MNSYFRKLLGPDDVEALWATAAPLNAGTLPSWLTIEDAEDYRRLDPPSADGLSASERAAYLAELQGWEDRGFVVEFTGGEPVIHMAKPPREAVWSIGIYEGSSLTELVPRSGNPILSRELFEGLGVSGVADPFLLQRPDGWHLFFELLNWRSYKGEIGLAISRDLGRCWEFDAQPVLAEEYHISYPYVFEWDDRVWMIPETHHAGGIRLYRAKFFPRQWELETTLVEGEYLADASIVQWRNRWYLFADASPGQRHDTLRLWHSDDLLGPWSEHPCSPVCRNDPVHARPAGRIIIDGGRVLRFAQSSIPEYGTSVSAFEITELSNTAYEERPLQAAPILKPSGQGWNAHGMHHLDASRQPDGTWLAVVDGWFLPNT